MQNDLLTTREHATEEELLQIISDFLAENSVPLEEKELTIALNSKMHRKLSELANGSDKSKAELFVELAQKGLEKA